MPDEAVGDYEEIWGPPISTLGLSFDRLDLVSSWRRCSLSADFAAHYISDHFDNPERVGGVLSTIINELIENAVKFSLPGSQEVRVAIPFFGNRVTLELRHVCSTAQALLLHAWVERVYTTDAEDLFVEQLEYTAHHAPESSGLGLITLRKDYGATIGVRLLPMDGDVVKIALQIHLPAHALEA